MTEARTTVLMTITADKFLSITEAAAELGLPSTALDPDFGVVAIDPDRGICTVRVFADALPKKSDKDGSGVTGPYSDPKIGPFGIPRR